MYALPRVVAEIGCNHGGDAQTARRLLSLAKECGATVGKFQKRNPRELLTREQYEAPHPCPCHSYGSNYGEHREALELSAETHRALAAHCAEIGLIYSCSVWDVTSAREIVALNPPMIKVGSPSNMHWAMQRLLRESYAGEVHISTGMTSREEVEEIVAFWERGRGDARRRLVLYSCTSGYPVAFENICLLELQKMQSRYAHRVKAFGFSGHHLGIAVDVAAYTLGAQWIERHFTLDRTSKGTDHAASLEPTGLRKLVRDLEGTHKALTYKPEGILLPSEQAACAKLKWRPPVGDTGGASLTPREDEVKEEE